MAYQALYRKWRPQTFEDVKGQDHIVNTLRNQLRLERIGHAYLFCGTRGTGKTTVAKLLARAVNCLSPVDGSPCNECEMCRRINEGASMNVIEIDAASNNGVDNIRQIREEVAYSPADGKYKVYIIDEVHMLSIGAFNALLKTLEEPPSYVIFILATTEAHKIPVTILSRCQRYDFRRITIETISSRLMELAQKESLEVEPKALNYVAKAADGSMRDALSLLDQCVSFYLGERLTYDHVLEVLGAVDTQVFDRLLGQILDQDILGVINLLDEVVIQGRELSQFVTDFTWYLRNLLLVKSSEDLEDVLDMSTESVARLKEMAKVIENNTLMRYIRIFSELYNQIRYATQKRILIEVALIKLCKPAMERNMESVLNRLSLIEEQLSKGVVFQSGPVSEGAQALVMEEPSMEAMPQALSEDIQAVIDQWQAIVSGLTPSMALMLKGGMVSQGRENQIIVGFNDAMRQGYFEDEKHQQELERIVSQSIGRQVVIVPKLLSEPAERKDFINPDKMNFEGIDVIYEDD